MQHDVRDVCDIFATRWESSKSIGRRICMHRPLDFRAEAPCYVTSALNGWYIIINITRLNMLITIINRARGEDRGLVACIKQGWCIAAYIMARSKEKQACNCACNVQRSAKMYYSRKTALNFNNIQVFFYRDADKGEIKILRFTSTACDRILWHRHTLYLWAFHDTDSTISHRC